MAHFFVLFWTWSVWSLVALPSGYIFTLMVVISSSNPVGVIKLDRVARLQRSRISLESCSRGSGSNIRIGNGGRKNRRSIRSNLPDSLREYSKSSTSVISSSVIEVSIAINTKTEKAISSWSSIVLPASNSRVLKPFEIWNAKDPKNSVGFSCLSINYSEIVSSSPAYPSSSSPPPPSMAASWLSPPLAASWPICRPHSSSPICRIR